MIPCLAGTSLEFVCEGKTKTTMCSLSWAVLLVLVPCVLCQSLDQTRVSGASGSEVVRAVVNLIHESCIFKHDKLFLRRLAFVKSVDGTDPKAFLPNSGGIWQVNTTQFTQIIGSTSAVNLFPSIKSHFGIDWQRVTMDDLKKPLFSGIGAALLMTMVNEEVPRSVEKQSAYYFRHFDSDTNAAHTFYTTATQLPNACKMSNLDLAFLVDTSASLSVTDFQKAKRFASTMIDSFTIGPGGVQVSFVTFSTGFKVHFNLNDHHTRRDIKDAIARVPYTTGATDTGAALAYVSHNVFMSATGARPDASKVVILVTDGRSTDHSKAVQAAQEAKKKGILIFAIGVGNKTFSDELNELATEPNCTHVIQLLGYGDLDALIDEIRQESCKAGSESLDLCSSNPDDKVSFVH
ncbi:collagen alpha-6(VI) chain-like [Gigantopelta aegis]|uniref:collagen alpha-6(VI) chain-like n=1 Tax=Gigantopelta aegis TaxID=1735272 RepID=UPI001B88E457|nr:collagen alpha-6(VI) chain-like [Gigantopelta aegis]